VKYAQFVAKLFMAALLVVLVGLSLGRRDSALTVLPFVAALVIVGVIELCASAGFKRLCGLHKRLLRSFDRDTTGRICLLLAWLVLSVPSLLVLTVFWNLLPAAVPAIDGVFKLIVMAPLLVAVKSLYSAWTGTPFGLFRFVVKS
jgi:hypothetical protein